MESHTNRRAEEQHRQAEIRQQIALLQAQLADPSDSVTIPQPPRSPKRKVPESMTLAPSTPSPKKKRKTMGDRPSLVVASSSKSAPTKPKKNTAKSVAKPRGQSDEPARSTVIERLASFNKLITNPTEPQATGDYGHKRDERLALVENLRPGPYQHENLPHDPDFDKFEPHSSIRLSSRNVPHVQFVDFLRGRYHVSPSQLYSVIRLLPDKQGYEVPVDGEWVTIAVVAERGPINHTRAPVGLEREDDCVIGRNGKPLPKKSNVGEATASGSALPKPLGKKYVNLKLIDFGCRSDSGANGGKSAIRGDAFLSLLLFKSDSFDTLDTSNGGLPRKIYKGGSRGAFEHMSKLREGAVIALLTPKILKPFQRSGSTPHPTTNILAVTPESEASISVIGYAQDLGSCPAVKKDGKPCGSWVDKRVSEVCEWHVQNAVERRRASRAEFSSATSGLGDNSKKKPTYDPTRQWGLKPEDPPSGSTYVFSGHVISGSAGDSRSMYVGETIGREAQAKASRISAKDADRVLKALLEKDKEGTRALIKARQASSRKDPTKDTNSSSSKRELDPPSGDSEEEEGSSQPRPSGKNAYSADVIRMLGFDPTSKAGKKSKLEVAELQRKLDLLTAAHASRPIELGPRPGKSRSCVTIPDRKPDVKDVPVFKAGPLLGQEAALPPNDGMVDLESSDVE
ncbi:hypothetical protein BDM02DRAFT_3268637 [Thelephora ganbajun]|uniref:Uncharacterized protein n=1 Tax=Thelephora ganbajun TaxID=370292 RepID=A0ACB6ZJ07_THEGA|nr:hypothetical protein BDM02DRAFT_3268637 [Thelephora ganbajun]